MDQPVQWLQEAKEAEQNRKKAQAANKEKEAERARDFMRAFRKAALLKSIDVQRARERAQETEAAREKRERGHRINELRSLVAALRSQLVNSGYDSDIAAHLARAEAELYRLLLTI